MPVRAGISVPDATENLRVATLAFTDALHMVLDGEIIDSVTIDAL